MVAIPAARRPTVIATSAVAGTVAAGRDLREDVAPEEARATIDVGVALVLDRAADHHGPAGDADQGTGIAWIVAIETRNAIGNTSVSGARRDCPTSKRSISVVTMTGMINGS